MEQRNSASETPLGTSSSLLNASLKRTPVPNKEDDGGEPAKGSHAALQSSASVHSSQILTPKVRQCNQIERRTERRDPHMSTSSVMICPVRREDAADLQTNCFSRNTLEEVQQHIEGSLAGIMDDRWHEGNRSGHRRDQTCILLGRGPGPCPFCRRASRNRICGVNSEGVS
jgi:hypothetical protein